MIANLQSRLSTPQTSRNKMTCFTSSDPAARNATLMYDLNNDNENLWIRSRHEGPLPLCSPPPNPLDFRCGVCFDQMVYVVCRNLTDGVKMMMEAGVVPVDLSKSDCPKPASDSDGDGDGDDDGDDGASNFLAIIIPILLLLLLLGVLLCVFRKRLLKFLGSQRPETEKSEQSVALENGTS